MLIPYPFTGVSTRQVQPPPQPIRAVPDTINPEINSKDSLVQMGLSDVSNPNSRPKEIGMLSSKASQYWQSTGPERSSANQLHRVRASRGEYLSDARPWQCRRQKRSCTCEAQDPKQSKRGWDAQFKSDSVLAKHGTRAVQREPVLSEGQQG